MNYKSFLKAAFVFIILQINLSFAYGRISDFTSQSYTINDGYKLAVNDNGLVIKVNDKTIAEFYGVIPKIKGDYGDYYSLFDVVVPSSEVRNSNKMAVYFDGEPIFLSKNNTPYSFILKSVKEDYLTRQFYIYILFNPKGQTLNVTKIIGVTRSPQCMNELVSVREFKLDGFSEINSRNANDIYLSLYGIKDDEDVGFKIPLLSDIELYSGVFNKYKKGVDITNDVAMFIMENESGERCTPSSYIVKRWFWDENIEASNNIAYFLSYEGYHQEAIELLEKIIDASPKRISAYINIADAFWAVRQYDKAHYFYREYISKMKSKQMGDKIPARALDRFK